MGDAGAEGVHLHLDSAIKFPTSTAVEEYSVQCIGLKVDKESWEMTKSPMSFAE